MFNASDLIQDPHSAGKKEIRDNQMKLKYECEILGLLVDMVIWKSSDLCY